MKLERCTFIFGISWALFGLWNVHFGFYWFSLIVYAVRHVCIMRCMYVVRCTVYTVHTILLYSTKWLIRKQQAEHPVIENFVIHNNKNPLHFIFMAADRTSLIHQLCIGCRAICYTTVEMLVHRTAVRRLIEEQRKNKNWKMASSSCWPGWFTHIRMYIAYNENISHRKFDWLMK